jgi:hypothetical protein
VATIEPFDQAMIERYLKTSGVRYLRDNEGDFLIRFSYDDDVGGELTVYLIASGKSKQIYVVRVSCSRPIDKSDWGRAVTLCNTWHREMRWPKAYLRVKDPATDTAGSIVLEEQIDLEKGIHQELFDDFTNTIIAASNQFWEWAHREHGL